MIQHNKPTIGLREALSALRVTWSGLLATGEEVRAFERELSEFLGFNNTVVLSSGSAALYMALWAANAKDKTVAIPVYACAALRNAVQMIGGNIVYVDNKVNSPNMDVDALNLLNPDIAIIPHMYGIPAEIYKVKKGIFVIEDCAQSLGAFSEGSLVGLLGDVSIFSFYATKLITSGGHGGAIASRNSSLLQEVRDYREFDGRRDDKSRFNFKITDLQAAIGRTQLKRIFSFIIKRESIFQKYLAQGWNLLDKEHTDDLPVRYRAVLNTLEPNVIREKLAIRGISCIVPLNDWELLSHKCENFINAYQLCNTSLSLPIYPSLSTSQVSFIIDNLNQVI